MSIPVQATANALAGDREHMSVSFPVSGDAELTVMAGVLSVIEAMHLTPHAAKRIGAWIEARFDFIAKESDRQRYNMEALLATQQSQQAYGSIGTPPDFATPWITTSGGTNLPQTGIGQWTPSP